MISQKSSMVVRVGAPLRQPCHTVYDPRLTKSSQNMTVPMAKPSPTLNNNTAMAAPHHHLKPSMAKHPHSCLMAGHHNGTRIAIATITLNKPLVVHNGTCQGPLTVSMVPHRAGPHMVVATTREACLEVDMVSMEDMGLNRGMEAMGDMVKSHTRTKVTAAQWLLVQVD